MTKKNINAMKQAQKTAKRELRNGYRPLDTVEITPNFEELRIRYKYLKAENEDLKLRVAQLEKDVDEAYAGGKELQKQLAECQEALKATRTERDRFQVMMRTQGIPDYMTPQPVSWSRDELYPSIMKLLTKTGAIAGYEEDQQLINRTKRTERDGSKISAAPKKSLRVCVKCGCEETLHMIEYDLDCPCGCNCTYPKTVNDVIQAKTGVDLRKSTNQQLALLKRSRPKHTPVVRPVAPTTVRKPIKF